MPYKDPAIRASKQREYRAKNREEILAKHRARYWKKKAIQENKAALIEVKRPWPPIERFAE